MPLPTSLKVALKEWAITCDALAAGKQIILLRKGGISESIGGFELEHRSFLLFPTYVHQNAAMLKADAQASLEKRDTEPSEITIASAGMVTDILQLQSREQMKAIDDEHIWAQPLIDMRFDYKPKNPLYLLIVRAFSLPSPIKINNTPDYAGCKSWVPLDHAIETAGAVAALDDAPFAARRDAILSHLR